jgi:hypothetical protein
MKEAIKMIYIGLAVCVGSLVLAVAVPEPTKSQNQHLGNLLGVGSATMLTGVVGSIFAKVDELT